MADIARQSLADRVHDHLVALLSLKQLKIGARINARKITEELSVSRTTVNKALDRLIDSGWVRINDHGRPIVAAYPPKKAVQVDSSLFDFSNQTDSIDEAILERIL